MNDVVHQIIFATRDLHDKGLNRGSTGNFSHRLDSDSFLITPSGIAAQEVSIDSLVRMNLDAQDAGLSHSSGGLTFQASSEWRFHRDIYRARSEVGAIVHVHSPFATSLACSHLEIPPFHYMVAIAGGSNIRCAKYATYGTQALSENVLDALSDRTACLIENHGMITVGKTMREAMATAIEVESLAQQYSTCLMVGGAVLLSEGEMAEVISKFAIYRKLSEN